MTIDELINQPVNEADLEYLWVCDKVGRSLTKNQFRAIEYHANRNGMSIKEYVELHLSGINI